jgi:glycosyltransferase involved in cell wall biosynthesis
MHLLYLCADRGIPIRGHKGSAVHVRAFSDALVHAGHTVTILTPRPGPADGPAPLATIIDCPLPDLPDDGTDRATRRDRQAQAYAGALTDVALAWLANNPCDAIYERYSLWSDVGARLRTATGLPLVLEVNAPLRREAAAHRHLSNDALAAQIETAQFGAADFLAVVSEPLAAYAAEHGANPAHVHVLPNGVEPQSFHPAVRGGRVRHKYGLHGRVIIGFAGRLRPWHDGLTLLRAFARLHATNSNYHLLLVGELLPEMAAGIETMGLATAVTCTGPVPHSDIPAHLAAMDVAVSSHAPTDEDTFYFSPLKLFEYLACGVPTVAANLGQPGRLIRPGHNGLLYPPGNDVALAAAIQQLVDNPAQTRAMAWNGAEMVLQNYTWSQNAARVLAWLSNETPTSLPAKGQLEADATLPILDAKLRQRLYRATRPDLTVRLLGRRLTAFNKNGPYRLKRIETINILKYKPNRRCVLAYRLTGRNKKNGRRVQQQVIGKVFRDGRGKRLFKLQALLYQHNFGPDAADRIHVPEALAYVPEMRMLVQASVPGRTLDELSLVGDIGRQVTRCAEGLAKLHHSRAFVNTAGNGKPLLKPYTLAKELDGLDDYTARLAETRPADMPLIETLRAALLAWADSFARDRNGRSPAPRLLLQPGSL